VAADWIPSDNLSGRQEGQAGRTGRQGRQAGQAGRQARRFGSLWQPVAAELDPLFETLQAGRKSRQAGKAGRQGRQGRQAGRAGGQEGGGRREQEVRREEGGGRREVGMEDTRTSLTLEPEELGGARESKKDKQNKHFLQN
jgi:hypothetical protein